MDEELVEDVTSDVPSMPSPEEETPELLDPVGDSFVSQDLSDELKEALWNLYVELTRPDDEIREQMVPLWQMYEHYWRGIQDIVYDKNEGAYRSASGLVKSAEEADDDYIGTKIINMYQAHGTSVASAIATETPKIPIGKRISLYP